MPLSTEDELAYEWITLLITEFEDAALKSGRRAGFLAVANGSTYAADVVLNSHTRTLNRVQQTRTKLQGKTSQQQGPNSAPSGGAGSPATQVAEESAFSKLNNEGLKLVDKDVDLMSLFGGSDSKLGNYLEDCIGCSLRLKFDWQLKPLNLLGPINAFLDSLKASLDRILGRVDKFKILQDLCWALNHLKTLCPQDIILVLLALKMLLKKYLLQMFNIRLDWTVLLGPLLNAILSALTDLLDNIFALLMAPLDCAISGMRAANDLLKASEDFLLSARASALQVGDFFKTGEAEGYVDSQAVFKDVSWTSPDPESKKDPLRYFNTGEGTSPLSPGNQGYDPGRLNVKTQVDPETPPAEKALRIPTGFNLDGQTTIGSAIKDPNFDLSTWLEKLIIPVQEAIAWLRETYEKFVGSIKSLGSLVSGSLGLSLDNLGVMIFLTDMISIVLMVIELLGSNLNINDWCSHLKDNPHIVEEAIRSRLTRDANVEVDQEGTLLIKQGPTIVGVIKTCVSNRTTMDNSVLTQWVKEIEAKGIGA